MAERHAFIAMVQIETHDARLSQEAINAAIDGGTAGGVARVRHAVLSHLPKDVTRLVAVFPVEHAKLLMMLHEAHGENIAALLREHGIEAEGTVAVRPPADYIPPTRD